ncbi:methylamine dehydrogenase light chain [Parapedomonas caeni]
MWFDRLTEKAARRLAHTTSRRHVLGKLGTLALGTAAVPLLPIARGQASGAPQAGGDPRNPQDCAYWRYCAIDGFLCTCCGGTINSCPPGTEPSVLTWVGTCQNPDDGKHYIVSYNDCCGKGGCGRCTCMRNEGDMPVNRPGQANDINWCLGSTHNTYHCTVSVLMGAAENG